MLRRTPRGTILFHGRVVWVPGAVGWAVRLRDERGAAAVRVRADSIFDEDTLTLQLAYVKLPCRVVLSDVAMVYPLEPGRPLAVQAERILRLMRRYYGLYKGNAVEWRRSATNLD